MPFTPLHFGPGLLGKGLAARSYSFSAFMASNVIIDCEALYYLTRHDYPVHRRLHTFVGAALVGVATAVLMIGLRRLLSSAWLAARTPIIRAEGTPLGIVVGAMAGALSHPFLDGLMHADIEPFQPWTAANPLRGLVGLDTLYVGCLLAGLLGAVLLALRRARQR